MSYILYNLSRNSAFLVRLGLLFLFESLANGIAREWIYEKLPQEEYPIHISTIVQILQTITIFLLLCYSEYMLMMISYILSTSILLFSLVQNKAFFLQVDQLKNSKSSHQAEYFNVILKNHCQNQLLFVLLLIGALDRTSLMPGYRFDHNPLWKHMLFDLTISILFCLPSILYYLKPSLGQWQCQLFLLPIISFILYNLIINFFYILNTIIQFPMNILMHLEFLGFEEFFCLHIRRTLLLNLLSVHWIFSMVHEIIIFNTNNLLSTKQQQQQSSSLVHFFLLINESTMTFVLKLTLESNLRLAGACATGALVCFFISKLLSFFTSRQYSIYLDLVEVFVFAVFYFSCIQQNNYLIEKPLLLSIKCRYFLHHYLLALICYCGALRAFMSSLLTNESNSSSYYEKEYCLIVHLGYFSILLPILFLLTINGLVCDSSLVYWKINFFRLFLLKVILKIMKSYAEYMTQFYEYHSNTTSRQNALTETITDAESMEFYVKTTCQLSDLFLDLCLIIMLFHEALFIYHDWISLFKILIYLSANARLHSRVYLICELYQRYLAVQFINHMPDATTSQLNNIEDLCVVCQEEMIEAKITPCGHFYHRACLIRWLRIRLSCPLCSSQFK